MAGLFRTLNRLLAAAVVIGALGDIDARAATTEPSEALRAAQERASALTKEGRYRKAIRHAEKALRLGRTEYGRMDVRVADLATVLGRLYELQGRYAEAERHYDQALRTANRMLGWKDVAVANSLSNLANVHRLLGRFEKAEEYYERALAVGVRSLGPAHPSLATYMNNLALLYRSQGRVADTERLYIGAMSLITETRGPDHPDVAIALNNIGSLYFDRGRYDDAERFLRRAVTLLEKIHGFDHPEVATGLNNLASVQYARGNYVDGERLLRRALRIRESRSGRDHPAVATSLSGLAAVYDAQGTYDEALPLLKRALAIREAAFGADHVSVAQVRNNLGVVNFRLARYAQAQGLLQQALDINMRRLGENHVEVAVNLNNLAEVSRLGGDREAAERLHVRALDIRARSFSETHPDVAYSAYKVARVMADGGRYREALVHARRATSIYRAIAAELTGQKSRNALTEQARRRPAFETHLEIASHRQDEAPRQRDELTAEAFEVAQLAQATGIAQTVQRMSARFAAGEGKLAEAVRARQDALESWRQLDSTLTKALSKPSAKRSFAAEQRLREEMARLSQRIAELDGLLTKQFPEYAELVNVRPVALTEARALVRPAEAMMVYLTGETTSFLWVVRQDRAALIRLEVSREELSDSVKLLRRALDPSGVETVDDLRLFDAGAAFELYQRIFAPAEPWLDGAEHILLVLDGPLQSIPFGVLVAEPPEADLSRFKGYRDLAWLVNRYAMTVLPSVNALRALRRIAAPSHASQPLIGFGDPLLGAGAGTWRGVELFDLAKDGRTDVNALRRLPRLPETADELRALARHVKSDETALYLQAAANETNLYELDRSGRLKDFRIIAFATHALMAGEFEGANEPALVMTPPEEAGERDDGLLTASEIAGLNLDANLVILSACNTAAPDGTPGAEGLSGLAKAFFYAGTRALLVSHWAVFSEATQRLITGIFAVASAEPGITRAEALRRSMLALMADADNPHYAHPSFWAPFILVGEGGVGAL